MKKIILITAALFAFAIVKAQTVTVNNHLTCAFHIIGTAEASPVCTGLYYVTTPNYIAGGGSIVLDIANPFIWAGSAPPPGSTWENVQVLDTCVLPLGGRCYTTVGDYCGAFTTNSYTQCCGGCAGATINVTWTRAPGGAVTVDIN